MVINKKRIKKTVAVIVALLFMITILPISAFAMEPAEDSFEEVLQEQPAEETQQETQQETQEQEQQPQEQETQPEATDNTEPPPQEATPEPAPQEPAAEPAPPVVAATTEDPVPFGSFAAPVKDPVYSYVHDAPYHVRFNVGGTGGEAVGGTGKPQTTWSFYGLSQTVTMPSSNYYVLAESGKKVAYWQAHNQSFRGTPGESYSVQTLMNAIGTAANLDFYAVYDNGGQGGSGVEAGQTYVVKYDHGTGPDYFRYELPSDNNTYTPEDSVSVAGWNKSYLDNSIGANRLFAGWTIKNSADNTHYTGGTSFPISQAADAAELQDGKMVITLVAQFVPEAGTFTVQYRGQQQFGTGSPYKSNNGNTSAIIGNNTQGQQVYTVAYPKWEPFALPGADAFSVIDGQSLPKGTPVHSWILWQDGGVKAEYCYNEYSLGATFTYEQVVAMANNTSGNFFFATFEANYLGGAGTPGPEEPEPEDTYTASLAVALLDGAGGSFRASASGMTNDSATGISAGTKLYTAFGASTIEASAGANSYFEGWYESYGAAGERLVTTEATLPNADVNANVSYTAVFSATRSLVLQAAKETKTYNGTQWSAGGYTLLQNNLAAGHTLYYNNVAYTGNETAPAVTGVNAAQYPLVLNAALVRIEDASGQNVSTRYKVETREGGLTINPMPLTLTANSNTYTFDGLPHEVKGFTTSPATLPGGDTVAASALARGVLPGSYPVEIQDVTFTSGLSGNYKLALENRSMVIEGTLPLVITGTHKRLPYNGKPQANTEFTSDLATTAYTHTPLPAGFALEGIEVNGAAGVNVNDDVNGTGVQPREQSFDLSKLKITYTSDGASVDATKFFVPSVASKGSLTILPRSVSVGLAVTPASIRQDATTLPTANVVYGTGENGFISGEGAPGALRVQPTVNWNGLDEAIAQSSVGIGPYTVTVGGAVAKHHNYTFKYTGGETSSAQVTVAQVGRLAYNTNGFAWLAAPEEDTKNYTAGDTANINVDDRSAPGWTFLGWHGSPSLGSASAPDFPAANGTGTLPYTWTPADAGGKTVYAICVPNFEDALTVTAYNAPYNAVGHNISVSGLATDAVQLYADATGNTPIGEDHFVNAQNTTPVYFTITRGGVTSPVMTHANATVTITKLDVQLTAANQTVKRGQAASAFALTDPTALDSLPTQTGELDTSKLAFACDYDPAATNPAASYPITPSGLVQAHGNFNFEYLSGTLTVTPAWQVVYNANGGTGGPGSSDTTLYAAGENVLINYSNVPTRPHHVFTGWDLSAANPSSPAYPASGQVSGFSMSAQASPNAVVTLNACWALDETAFTFAGYTGVYDGQAHSIRVDAPQDLAVSVNYTSGGTSSQQPLAFTNVGDSDVDATVTTADGISTQLAAKVSILARPVALAPQAQSAVYNGMPQAFSTSNWSDVTNASHALSEYPGQMGLLPNHTVDALATAVGALVNAGSYPKGLTLNGTLTISGGGDVTSNYDITTLPGAADIQKAPLAVAADSFSIELGEAMPALTVGYTPSPLPGQDANKTLMDVLSGGLNRNSRITLICGYDADQPQTGKYPITFLDALEADNYTITTTPGTLTVTKKAPERPGAGGGTTPGGTNPGDGGGRTTPGSDDSGTGGSGGETTPGSLLPGGGSPLAFFSGETATPDTTGGPALIEEPGTQVLFEQQSPLFQPKVPVDVIPDAAVPMGMLQSHWALLNLMITILSIVFSFLLVVMAFKPRKQEEGDEDDPEALSPKMRKAKSRRSGIVFRLLSIAAGIVSFCLFYATQDISTPMVFSDSWTLTLMTVLVLQACGMLLLKRARSLDGVLDEEDDKNLIIA